MRYDFVVSGGSSGADARRKARATWPIVRQSIHGDPGDDISDQTTASERIAMMAELAEAAWRVSGRPLPQYERSQIPGRIFRRGGPGPEDG